MQRDIRFATAGGVDLTLDVYQPASPGVHPSIVQVYGGAWQRGSPHDNGRFAAHLASLGYVVFAVDYRHAPQWRWPAQMADMRAALIGRSAGAQLALMAAYDSPALPIKAVVNLYGPTDLEDGYLRPPRPDPFDIRAIEEAFLGGTPGQVPQQYRDASPITRVSAGSPATLSIYGSRDHIVHRVTAGCCTSACAGPGCNRSCWRFRGRSTRSTLSPMVRARRSPCITPSDSWRAC